MLHRALFIVLLTTAVFLAGCQSSPHSAGTESADTATITRDQGYGLLYSTISEECDVDKVLIIKRPSPAVTDLIKSIGQFSREAKATLENLAKEEPAITLDNPGLPDVETRTRDAISTATSRQIVFNGGKDLEFRLLLTQHEALNYITHLATSVAEREVRENRKRYLGQLSKQSDALHEQVLLQLKTPYVGQAK